MARYECSVCGYVFDEASEGQGWGDLPHEWTCPVCGAGKDQFESSPDEGPTVEPAEEARGGSPETSATRLPQPAILAHRIFGYFFLAIYVVLMIQMVPRLWSYQIEFPARTVVHISLGMAIGAALLLKISIVRFFRRLDQSLVPTMGTGILVGSVVLIGISIPGAFQEALATGALFAEENQERVSSLLLQTGLDPGKCAQLSTRESLRAGQRVLRNECTECHDLRTVLAKPRTPDHWRQTVHRMADRTTSLNPLSEDEQWRVTAYLIALSPQLQKSTQELRDAQARREQSKQAAEAISDKPAEEAALDLGVARSLFEAKCSQCHPTSVVMESPPESAEEARKLVAWMVEEGLEAAEAELAQLVQYLTLTNAMQRE
jgi:rubredoxin/cytochrome c5